MKQSMYLLMTAASALLLTSCAADEPFGPKENDGSVTFSLELQQASATRAGFGEEGITTNQLSNTVFDADGKR